MTYQEKSLKLHEENRGKIQVVSKVPVKNKDDLSTAYTPGVAEPCKKIHENKEDVYKYTNKGNMVAVVSDGTAVLGLGDIGPEAAMPVMSGKAVLFKTFADVDAFPICLDTTDVDEIVQCVKNIAPVFGGINLEDISAPRCFEIEERLKKELNIPVFHDDQHGTAIVVLAGLINALRLAKKSPESTKLVINGCGSAGIAIGKLLMRYGFANVIFCDKAGIVTKETATNPAQLEVATISNPNGNSGSLRDALKDADIFIGVSAPNLVDKDMVASMQDTPILFAMANPIPEIFPEVAKEVRPCIMGTGRSDYPNQINNVLAFPGIFRGALDARAKAITEKMKLNAALAIAKIIPEEELTADYIIPDPFDERVAQAVAQAVANAVE